ncbi:MAG: hypothetical protein GDA46_03535 [Bdellovibrionales bacterium]|nr:hypothetical protein [Bdellovibrionales bacterium]
MKFFKIILMSLFLFSCGNKEGRERRERDYRNTYQERDVVRDSDRLDTLNRLRNNTSKTVVRSFIKDRYSGYGINYRGQECGDLKSCVRICQENFSVSFYKRCYRAPVDFIESLEKDLIKLVNISDLNSADISPGFIKALLEFDEELLYDLVARRMSEGDVKFFLAWIAVNEDVSQVFLDEKKASLKILEEAFEILGDYNTNSRNQIQTGFNTDLVGIDDTFLSLTASYNNEYGFILAYELLDDFCSGNDCKLEIFCAREDRTSFSRSRSRVFGYSRRRSDNSSCRTSTDSRQRSSGGLCYTHGADVWSFLDDLIEEDEIRDNFFEDNPITVDRCNKFCGGARSETSKCRKQR